MSKNNVKEVLLNLTSSGHNEENLNEEENDGVRRRNTIASNDRPDFVKKSQKKLNQNQK